MEPEKGDDYLRRLATYIRTNEKSLAEAGLSRRRRVQQPQATDYSSYLNPLSWLGSDSSTPTKPVILTTDTHHLFYVLMRLEALGYDVGTLDVQIDNPSRPMSYVNLYTQTDKSETLSIASFRSSLSAVSKLSLGAGWWSRTEPPSIDVDLKFIYSSFTKLPALTIHAPSKSVIAEFMDDPPSRNALPLDVFKNLQLFSCVDIDPRTLLGWDRLAESLRSLTIKKSGLEDIWDIFVGAVLDDQARREGSASRKRRRRIPRHAGQRSIQTTPLPDTVVEDDDGESNAESAEADPENPENPPSPSPPPQLSSLKWAFLKHLSLADNSLTFIPPEPLSYLTSVTHLDLSSNLLVSVPPALSSLYNLVSLNLADNMIDSVLGIYLNLGQVLSLNLSHNRLESLCGLERLHALERIDLRSNIIEESSEVGRLATLPNISEVWIEGNPFVDYEERYRVACFNYFWKEGKVITLDGSPPGFYEKQSLAAIPTSQSAPQLSQFIAHSPPVVPIRHALPQSHSTLAPPSPVADGLPTPPSSNASPHLNAQPSAVAQASSSHKPKRKHQKRVVDFGSTDDVSHSKLRSEDSDKSRGKSKHLNKKGHKSAEKTARVESPTPSPPHAESDPSTPNPSTPKAGNSAAADGPQPRRSLHGRHRTEYHSPASSTYGDSSPYFDMPPTPFSARNPSRSATISSRSATRRARMSASMWEPGVAVAEEEHKEGQENAEEFRRRIEALKKDMGDGWLKVFSQSEIKSPS